MKKKKRKKLPGAAKARHWRPQVIQKVAESKNLLLMQVAHDRKNKVKMCKKHVPLPGRTNIKQPYVHRVSSSDYSDDNIYYSWWSNEPTDLQVMHRLTFNAPKFQRLVERSKCSPQVSLGVGRVRVMSAHMNPSQPDLHAAIVYVTELDGMRNGTLRIAVQSEIVFQVCFQAVTEKEGGDTC